MDDKPRDFLGREICLHDLIVYPYRTRSTMVLKKAIVTGFRQTEGGLVICGYNPDSATRRRLSIHNAGRTVVIKGGHDATV